MSWSNFWIKYDEYLLPKCVVNQDTVLVSSLPATIVNGEER
jgi:hypothetical protein